MNRERSEDEPEEWEDFVTKSRNCHYYYHCQNDNCKRETNAKSNSESLILQQLGRCVWRRTATGKDDGKVGVIVNATAKRQEGTSTKNPHGDRNGIHVLDCCCFR
jgi:hypothetical protein